MRIEGSFRVLGLLATFSICALARAQDSLVVHEWGTITTRHAADGTPQGRLNRIEQSEVLPAFVHRYEPPQSGLPFGKGSRTPGHPDVTMRLETPVIYFYGADSTRFAVHVSMRGGILNEFYPSADASLAVDQDRVSQKLTSGKLDPNKPIPLDNYLRGELDWPSVMLDASAKPPQTSSPIWLAPRSVGATSVKVANEGERYLFYRGVAHLDALLSTRHTKTNVRLLASTNLSWLKAATYTLPYVWVVDVRNDGAVAFQQLNQVETVKAALPSAGIDVRLFTDDAYSAARTEKLRASMRKALIEAGLFEDEATAMLATWDASYFKTSGLRVFYVVPREWIDYYLPLSISAPNKLTRVLIGRIDLM